MKPVEIAPNIFWIGVNDASTKLFEGLWTIENEGISYNSYLIKDEKTVLVDLCKEVFWDQYLQDQIGRRRGAAPLGLRPIHPGVFSQR